MATFDPDFTSDLKQRIEKWRNHWKDNDDTYNEMTQFVWGNQWLDDEARVFENYKKIPLTFNKCAPLLNALCGEQRENTPSLQVFPSDDVDEQTAEIREALVKDITLDSDSKVVFQTSFQCAATGGYGAFRICTEYESDMSFHQVVRFKKILMPSTCYWDMSSENECKTDGMFAGFEVRVSREKFKILYGEELEKDMHPDQVGDGTNAKVFNDDDSISVIYDYSREYNTETLRMLSNGRTVSEKEFKELVEVEVDGQKLLVDNGEMLTVEDKRDVPRYKVIARVCAGEYILEQEEFPSQQLPVVFVDQNSFYDKQGKQIIRPFLKDAKDAQRYINYLGTQSAYLLKISRYDQFMLSKENARGNDTQQIWRDPSNVQGGLLYDESKSGAKPESLRPPELPQSLVTQYERALNDIQSSTGMYNAQLGEQGNEVSGTAVKARTKRGAKNTYIPYDSLNRAIACAGQIVNEMIPKLYDTERTVNLNMKDKGMTPITLNKGMDAYGGKIENDMTKGEYKIRLLPGPSWEGQKEEALESMQAIMQANPQVFPMIADLYVENLPLANSLELRNRLRTMVPPEIIQAGKTGEPPPPKPQQPDPQAIAAQQAQQAQMAQLKIAEKQLELQQQKLQMDAQAKSQEIQLKWQELEDKRLQTATELQEMELKYMAETGRTETDMNIAHANNIVKILTHKGNQNHGINEYR